LCSIFALIGAVPVLAGLMVRTRWVRAWAAQETARVVSEELGARASYTVGVQPWPLAVTLEDVVVEGDDGAGPFLTVERASVRPRLFSLLAGKLDVGDVEVTGAHARVVVRDGELTSFRPKIPEQERDDDARTRELPLSSVSLTDADVDLDIEGLLAHAREVDVDLVVESSGALELGLRAGGGLLTRKRVDLHRAGEDAVDEDRLCKLEARARYEPDADVVLVRRLVISGAADFDPAPGTRPPCDLAAADWRRLDVALGAVRVPLKTLRSGDGVPPITGRVSLTAPAALVHRFVPFPHATGSATLELDLQEDAGSRFPIAQGHVRTDFLGVDGKVFADSFEGRVEWKNERVLVSDATVLWGDGTFHIREITLAPFSPGLPLEAKDIVADGVNIQGLLRDLGAHPQSHVGWLIEHVTLDRFGGVLDPVRLSGDLVAKTRDFGVYDRPAQRSDRVRMVSVDRGDVTGKLVVGMDAVVLENMHLVTPKSDVRTTVRLGYKNELGLDVAKGSRVDLSEISPLVSVDIGGKVTIEARGSGTFEVPRVEGDLSVEGFHLGGFDAGDVRRAKAVFMPLWIELADVELEKNESLVTSTRTKVDFAAGADVLVDAEVESLRAPFLKVRDFLEVFHFTGDPRFEGLAGTAIGTARVHYALGGPEDRCGGGALEIRAKTQLDRPELFGETFESGEMQLTFRYDDMVAGDAGMEVALTSASLRDDKGSVAATLEIARGGHLRGNLVASGLSLDRIESLGAVRDYVDGEVQALATLGGTVSRPRAEIDVSLGPIRLGARRLMPSRFFVKVEPEERPPEVVGTSRCGQGIGKPFDLATWEKDLPSGQLRLNGQLAGGQIRLEDVTISRQRSAVTKGRVSLSGLDLGTVLGGVPGLAFTGQVPEGSISAQIDLEHLELARLESTKATIELFDLELERGGRTIELGDASDPIAIDGETLVLPRHDLVLADKRGLRVGFSAEGRIDRWVTSPTVDATLSIDPFDLSKLKSDLSSVERIQGTLSGAVALKGPLAKPELTGGAKLRKGALTLTDPAVSLDDVEVDVTVGDGELRVTRATAKMGAGTIDVTGRVPIVGLGLGAGSATITARSVTLPVEDGIQVVADADLEASLKPSGRGETSLPEVRGTVGIVGFEYTRPIALSVDLAAVRRSIGRVDVDAFDPEGDLVRFDVNVVSQRPLAVRTDLADLRLEVVGTGVQIAGTNQRYGARGSLRLLPDSKLRLRNHEFDVKEGYVRFEDPNEVKALVDVRATTEIRRYATQDTASDPGAVTAGATAGQWDVSVHAHGSTDDMKLDLTSDPALDQDDILLLLTVGMTRAEIDRSLVTSLGETLGLEALGALTGADKVVKSVVPIDYFHFGSGYSSKTGRTEPNVTIGKRITDDVRASVTTTLTESDIGATLEWRLQKGVSVQAAYDNTNDIGSVVGNLGADLRWRLEFE
jgi:translocation and assembly module TamB